MYSILVRPIHPKEEIQIVLKRKLEKLFYIFIKRNAREKKQLKNPVKLFILE